MRISVVVPSFNGCGRLEILIPEIDRALKKDYEIIIVDDGSSRKPIEAIKGYQRSGMSIKGVFLKGNCGQQLATLAGLKVSKGDYVFTIDDDMEHNPENFEKILSYAESRNLDAVFAVPERYERGFARNHGSKIRDMIFSVFLDKPSKIRVSSFRLLHRSVVGKILNDTSEYRYLSVEILKHAVSVENISIPFMYCSGVETRYGIFKLILLAFALIRSYPFFPERFRKTDRAEKMEYEII